MDITPHQAVRRMKELTELGIPFSFVFETLNTTKGKCEGTKTVTKAMLRKSLREDQSDQSHQLISYIDLSNSDASRQFRISLLLKFNEYTIKP